jgi:hypothetical protein
VRVLVTAASRHDSTREIAECDSRRPYAASEQLIELGRARGHRVFAGRLERGSLGFAERAAAKAVHAPEGDCRDWDAIDAFAGETAAELSAQKAAR